MAEPFSLEALEKVHAIATLIVASANRRTMTHGTPGNRVTVNLNFMRELAAAVEEASPGAINRVRAAIANATTTRRDGRTVCHQCGRSGGELTENGCPEHG